MQSPSPDFDFCPVLAQLLRERKVTGRSGKTFDGLAAISTVNNLVMLRRMMLEFRAEHTLEVGLSFGGSGLVFTASHRDLGHAPSAQHVALDPFQGQTWDSCGLEAIHRAGLSGYLDFKPEFSSLALPALLQSGRRFDLIYIDGSHIFEDVFIDAYYCIRLLSDGGIVTFDDSSDRHVAKVIRFLRTSLASPLEEMDLSRFRDDQGRTLKYRAARLLGRSQMTAFRRIGNPERAWNAEFVNF
jgi:hypothetical protein